MNVDTQTLADFLLARIAEDEADAISTMNTQAIRGHSWDGRSRRVLAECEAKRRIVELHQREWVESGDEAFERCAECSFVADPWPCGTLRALALPYADHPGYREEWRP